MHMSLTDTSPRKPRIRRERPYRQGEIRSDLHAVIVERASAEGRLVSAVIADLLEQAMRSRRWIPAKAEPSPVA